MTVPTKSLTLIAGAGPGNGMAFARRFAGDGQLALLTRDPRGIAEEAARLDDAMTYACDVTDGSAVGRTLGDIRARQGEPSTLIYNAGSAAFGSFADITAEKFEESWRINAFGAFLVAREVVPAMRAAGRGTVIFVGATASLRGGPESAAFGPAKAAQRSLAESMARSLWPEGIHVALIVLDGRVASAAATAAEPERTADDFIDPEAVAETAHMLSLQPRSAWTFETILRPSRETW